MLGLDHTDGPNGATRLKKRHSVQDSFKLSHKKNLFSPKPKQNEYVIP